jgi:TRAP-type C4-dicarboxylate transport system permease small subunit
MMLLKKMDNALAWIEKRLLVGLLALMVILMFLHVLLRGLHRYADLQWANMVLGRIDWTEIVVRLLVLWVTFLGASLLTRDHKHIKIDLMSFMLPKKWQPVQAFVLSIACIFICIVMVKASIEFLIIEISFGGILFLGFPSWIGQIIIPLGFLMILLRFVFQGIAQILTLVQGNRK